MKLFITIDDVKKHLNIDFADDDDYLNQLIDTAQDAIQTYLQRDLSDFIDDSGALKPAVKHAIRLMVGNLYANRESVAYASAIEVPYTLAYLLQPLKKFKGATPMSEEGAE